MVSRTPSLELVHEKNANSEIPHQALTYLMFFFFVVEASYLLCEKRVTIPQNSMAISCRMARSFLSEAVMQHAN